MIQKFVDRFNEHKDEIRAFFSKEHPSNYKDIVELVFKHMSSESEYQGPDPNNIREIDDGHYQGTLLYLVAARDYQPSTYYYVFVSYGSCSGCDTLQGIHDYGDDPPTEEQINDYMTLALHIVQGIKKISAYSFADDDE